MEEKLNEAAITGDLFWLIELPHRQYIASLSTAVENPLLTASGFGHVDSIKEVLYLNPSLARRLNSHRLSPLHLASSKGHVEAAKALLESDPGVCFMRDQKGRTPLHIAAEKGQVEVLGALVKAKPVAVRVMTDEGDSILHLCVKHNQLEALMLLVEKVPEKEFLNLKDDKNGDTILHLLAVRGHYKVIKILLRDYEDQLEVNAVNIRSLTALDLSMLYAFGDWLAIKKILISAGAERAKQLPKGTKVSGNRIRKNQELKKYLKWLNKTRETLMVVAILMATVTFQAGMNPPGGVWQSNDPHNKGIRAGQAIMSYIAPRQYVAFIIFNSLGFLASLSLIVVLVGRFSFHERVALWATIVWIAVISILLIYTCSLSFLTSKNVSASFGWSTISPISYGFGWGLLLTGILLVVRFLRLVPWLLNTSGIMRFLHWILQLIQHLPLQARTAIKHVLGNKDTNAESIGNP